MSNREYYGDAVPLDLAEKQSTSTHSIYDLQAIHNREETSVQGCEQPSLAPGHLQPWTDLNSPHDTQRNPAKSYQQTQFQEYDPTGTEDRNVAPTASAGAGAGEEERGLGSTLVGGTGGAYVGHHLGKNSNHGTLGAIGGAVAGAIVANLASNMVKDQHHGSDSHHDHDHRDGHGHGRENRNGNVGMLREHRRDRLERKLDRLP